MPKHFIMDQTGHSTVEFDESNTVSIADAMARFAELTSKGYTAARKSPDGKHQLLREFDPAADTLFFPRLQGG